MVIINIREDFPHGDDITRLKIYWKKTTLDERCSHLELPASEDPIEVAEALVSQHTLSLFRATDVQNRQWLSRDIYSNIERPG